MKRFAIYLVLSAIVGAIFGFAVGVFEAKTGLACNAIEIGLAHVFLNWNLRRAVFA